MADNCFWGQAPKGVMSTTNVNWLVDGAKPSDFARAVQQMCDLNYIPERTSLPIITTAQNKTTSPSLS